MKKLHIIYTGGTIGGEDSNEKIIKKDLPINEFYNLLSKRIPDIKEKCEISLEEPLNKFSENMLPANWSTIAKSVYEAAKRGVDCIVIAHGTDTMSYTAAAISFMVEGLKIPVIITGSNFPLQFPKTDAVQNFSDAVRVALDERFIGVFLTFSGIEGKPSTIHLGTRVIKVKFEGNCFESINTEPIGVLKRNFPIITNYNIKIVNKSLLEKIVNINYSTELNLLSEVNENISVLKIYPGFDLDRTISNLTINSPKSIILESYSLRLNTIFSLIGYSIRKNIPIFVITHCNTFDDNSCNLTSAGAVLLKNIPIEVAIPKLIWVLGQVDTEVEIIHLMKGNVAGEFNYDKQEME